MGHYSEGWGEGAKFRRTQKKISESQKRRHALRKIMSRLYQMEVAR